MTETDIITKIQALLAKAEGGTTPEEAEALIAKAQQLMARYAIDEAMLRHDQPSTDKPVAVEITLEAPYAAAKVSLINVIAKSNGCQLVSLGNGRVWLGGFSSDVESTKALFSSLLVIGTAAMVAERRRHPEVHGRSFASSFWHMFGYRIGKRLEEARQAAEAEAGAERGAHSVALALVDRSRAVKGLVDEQFGGGLRTQRRSFSLNAGAAAGDRAGRTANLRLDHLAD